MKDGQVLEEKQTNKLATTVYQRYQRISNSLIKNLIKSGGIKYVWEISGIKWKEINLAGDRLLT